MRIVSTISSDAQKRPRISRQERPSALNGPSRSNSSAGIESDHTVPSHSAGMPHGSENTNIGTTQITDSRKTIGARRSPKRSERLNDGSEPSHASQTPLKSAVNETRK